MLRDESDTRDASRSQLRRSSRVKSTACEISASRLLCFAIAFGVRTRPRVAFAFFGHCRGGKSQITKPKSQTTRNQLSSFKWKIVQSHVILKIGPSGSQNLCGHS